MWTKFLCWFIGWDYGLLKECSAASKKALHRYAGAVMLLMLIWAYIGYAMATRYFEVEQTIIKIAIAIVFAFFLWMIERQIILMVGKGKAVALMRSAIAIVMALIGATIIDQILFAKDIKSNLSEKIDDLANTEFILRKSEIDKIIVQVQNELDSLEFRSVLLTNEINKQPYIQTHSIIAVGVDSVGKPVYAANKEPMPNPKFKDRERIDLRIDALRKNIELNYENLQGLKERIWKETKENVGLLTELEVIFSSKVIFSGWSSGIFYAAVFFFFLFVELLVVSGKIFSKKCDYEVLVEHQQAQKIRQIVSMIPTIKEDNLGDNDN